MSNRFDRFINGDLASGVFRLDMTLRPSTICGQVNRTGLRCCYLDGTRVIDKRSLLAESAEAMSFPGYFGHNWDALEECITDLSWIKEPGCVLLYDHAAVLAALHPDVWNTLFDVLTAAIKYWASQPRPFYVLLRNTGRIQQTVTAL